MKFAIGIALALAASSLFSYASAQDVYFAWQAEEHDGAVASARRSNELSRVFSWKPTTRWSVWPENKPINPDVLSAEVLADLSRLLGTPPKVAKEACGIEATADRAEALRIIAGFDRELARRITTQNRDGSVRLTAIAVAYPTVPAKECRVLKGKTIWTDRTVVPFVYDFAGETILPSMSSPD